MADQHNEKIRVEDHLVHAVLVVMANGDASIISGDPPEGRSVISPDDALEVLAWATANGVEAVPVFSAGLHRTGSRVWTLVPVDEDAAFVLRLRWL